MNDALAGGAHQNGLSGLESFTRLGGVAGCNDQLDFADKAAHAANPIAIILGAPECSTIVFLGRLCIRH